MRRICVEPTDLDRELATQIAATTTPAMEGTAQITSDMADWPFVIGSVALLWTVSRAGTPRQRSAIDHLAASVIAADLTSRLLKRIFAQRRPDRSIHGIRRGIPRSGHAYGAFPSGHAMHAGAASSALARLFPAFAPLIWGVAGLVSATRVVLLAHWVSDVLAGFAMGAAIENAIANLRTERRRP
jgi:membrane-associated phospholipid phosphatase